MTDLYAQISELGADLRTCGMGLWAERLDDAVIGGATGSEILMAIRWNLQQMLASEPPDSAVRDKANSIISSINAMTTSIGILHYRADASVHIVPGRPQ